MDRVFFSFFLMLGLLVGLVCSSEKGGRYDEGEESLLSRSKRSQSWDRSCPCPGLNELQHPKQHNHDCPCDGFHLHGLPKNRQPHRKPRKIKPHALHKKKCRAFLKHCALKGIHNPL